MVVGCMSGGEFGDRLAAGRWETVHSSKKLVVYGRCVLSFQFSFFSLSSTLPTSKPLKGGSSALGSVVASSLVVCFV